VAGKVTQPAKETSPRHEGLDHEANLPAGNSEQSGIGQGVSVPEPIGMLTVGFLLWCWQFVNKRAASGVDRQDARSYQENLRENIETLVAAVKGGRYPIIGTELFTGSGVFLEELPIKYALQCSRH